MLKSDSQYNYIIIINYKISFKIRRFKRLFSCKGIVILPMQKKTLRRA